MRQSLRRTDSRSLWLAAVRAEWRCADELAKLGYAVTIFEAQTRPGGLLVNGIPSFKLEKRIVDRRFDLLHRRGVAVRCGVTVGRDIPLSSLRENFDAVYLAIGAQKPKQLDIPGADLRGVFHALPFLIQKNVGTSDELPIEVRGKRVAVLGGGDTAMDCLRTAIRCGAREAICIYRRDLENMPGSRREYCNATEEGAQFMLSHERGFIVRQRRRRSLRSALCANGTGRTGCERPSQTDAQFQTPSSVCRSMSS